MIVITENITTKQMRAIMLILLPASTIIYFSTSLAVWDDTTTGNDTNTISIHTHTHTHTHRERERETIAIVIAKNKTTAQPTVVINRWYIIFLFCYFYIIYTHILNVLLFPSLSVLVLTALLYGSVSCVRDLTP